MMAHRLVCASALALSALLAAPRAALASQSFPDTVKSEWQMPGSVPACTLCHQTLLGGFGTATKPFGRAVLMNGASAVDTGALRQALRALKAAGSDVDHDGVTDYDELQAGTDPDVADATSLDGGVAPDSFDDYPIPQTGCSVSAVGRSGPGLVRRMRLTPLRPSPTVGPTSGAEAPGRRFSDDAFLVCGLVLGAVFGRLRVQRKRVASPAR